MKVNVKSKKFFVMSLVSQITFVVLAISLGVGLSVVSETKLVIFWILFLTK